MVIDSAPQPHSQTPPTDEEVWLCFTHDGCQFSLPIHLHPESISEWKEGLIESYRKVPGPGRSS